MSGPALIRHFAIGCDDVDRARRFYAGVFGWRIVPWGPPDYYQILTGTAERPGLLGDLRVRREPAGAVGVHGTGGYECTIGVESLSECLAAIVAHGGRVVSQPYGIDGVGELAYFEDSEGNRAGVMQYRADFVWPEGTGA